MKTWTQALQAALISGAVASLTSTLVLSLRGKRENGTPYGANNAISHWVWGDEAAQHDEFSLKHTVVGYTIHHASSTFWATFYEKYFSRRQEKQVGPALLGGSTVAAAACFVDYQLTPHRLQPGYEMRLSKRSLFLVYAAFGLGLAACDLLATRRRTTALPAPLQRRAIAQTVEHEQAILANATHPQHSNLGSDGAMHADIPT
ncbi:MAG TPA: hypothetical protein VD885_03095 [Methylophilaceae bacterium]|nr:hypothetical protein [Methylophilaceae bacterium]